PKGNFYATRVDPYRYSKEYFYLHPDRAKSFALHPYFRNEYYNAPVDPQQARYSLNRLSDVKYAEENAYIPQPSWIGTCDNYSFSRPNYRIPPYRYMCK
ncbi:hypothetical protein KKG16_00365, partial [Patescibacteria group bacterium]|nr:hypothetical protein [Patescibacteria group bacterium]